MHVSDLFNALLQKYDKHFLDLPEVSNELGMPLATIHNQISAGRFEVPTCKFGDRRRVATVALATFIAQKAGLAIDEPIQQFPTVTVVEKKGSGGRPREEYNEAARKLGYIGFADLRRKDPAKAAAIEGN